MELENKRRVDLKTHTHSLTRTYTHTHLHAYAHMHTHTHAHTHTRTIKAEGRIGNQVLMGICHKAVTGFALLVASCLLRLAGLDQLRGLELQGNNGPIN